MGLLGPSHGQQVAALRRRAVLAVTALCAACTCAATVFSLPLALLGLPGYFLSEGIFAIYYFVKLRQFSSRPQQQKPEGDYDPQRAFELVMGHLSRAHDIREYLCTWFRIPISQFSSIRDGNVADFLAYAFFYTDRAGVDAAGKTKELWQMVHRLEDTWQLHFPAGHDDRLHFMAHLWEPLRHMYRPLAFYVSMEACGLLAGTMFYGAGFKRRTVGGFTYYVRPGSTPELQQQPPLFLLHGIGVGLLAYTEFIWQLAATGRPVIALECRHVAMRLCKSVPKVDDVADAVLEILQREGAASAAFVCHSYGTAVGSRLVLRAPEAVHRLCLIDPVCFATHMPRLLRNFIYAMPRTGSWLGDFMMHSAARELHCAASLCRNFYWSDIAMWSVPEKSLVVLAGGCILVSADEVYDWLQASQPHTKLLKHPTMAHAAFLLDSDWQRTIVAEFLTLLDASDADTSDVDARIDRSSLESSADAEVVVMSDRSLSVKVRHSDSASSYQAQLETEAEFLDPIKSMDG